MTACLLYLPLIFAMTCLILWYLWLISTFQLEFATASTANTTTTAKSGTSSSTEDPFPVLAVGKDGRGNYYVNSTFGTPGQRQRLLVDIIQPYINLVSEQAKVITNTPVYIISIPATS